LFRSVDVSRGDGLVSGKAVGAGRRGDRLVDGETVAVGRGGGFLRGRFVDVSRGDGLSGVRSLGTRQRGFTLIEILLATTLLAAGLDRKSTRLNSSHVKISYAVFCLKKKNTYILN